MERDPMPSDAARAFVYVLPRRWWFNFRWVSGGLPLFTVGVWAVSFGRTLK